MAVIVNVYIRPRTPITAAHQGARRWTKEAANQHQRLSLAQTRATEGPPDAADLRALTQLISASAVVGAFRMMKNTCRVTLNHPLAPLWPSMGGGGSRPPPRYVDVHSRAKPPVASWLSASRGGGLDLAQADEAWRRSWID